MSKLSLKDRSWSFCAANCTSNPQLHSFLGAVAPSLSQSPASQQFDSLESNAASLQQKKNKIHNTW